MANQVGFLPREGGRAGFWKPIADAINLPLAKVLFGWPGFGDVLADAPVTKLTDLVDYVFKQIPRPMYLVAQLMGCIVAILMALKRPTLIEKLVLVGTSDGINMAQFNGEEWRADYLKKLPEAATT